MSRVIFSRRFFSSLSVGIGTVPRGRAGVRRLAFATPAACGALWLLAGGAQAQPGRGPSPVVVAEATESLVSSGETFVGTVRPLRRATIGSAVDGRVVEFPINVGDRVEEGQMLAQLLIETISLEKAAAEAELELRQQELTELKNGSRPEEIEQARARMEAATATRDYMSQKRDRTERLRQGNATSEDLLQEATSQSLAADAAYSEARAAWRLAVEGTRVERVAQAVARVALQQAMVDKLDDQMKKHTVITRFTGYVTAEHTEIGAWVSRGDPVAEVVELDTVEVEAFVLDSQVEHVHAGQEVLVSLPAVRDAVFTGTVASVTPQADERTRTFPVRVHVTNEIRDGQPLIKGGMLARVTLRTGPEVKAVLVPKDAIVLGGPAPMVYVVVPDAKNASQKTVAPVLVELGVAIGDRLQVLPSQSAPGAAVKPGDEVVVLGNERLRPGQPIQVIRSTAPVAAGRESEGERGGGTNRASP